MSHSLKKFKALLLDGNIEDAIAECDKQRGSIANILRQGLERYQTLANDNKVEADQKIQEVQAAIEEAMMLEVPLLERNLVVLSTIASVSVLIGLVRNCSRNDKSIPGAGDCRYS